MDPTSRGSLNPYSPLDEGHRTGPIKDIPHQSPVTIAGLWALTPHSPPDMGSDLWRLKPEQRKKAFDF